MDTKKIFLLLLISPVFFKCGSSEFKKSYKEIIIKPVSGKSISQKPTDSIDTRFIERTVKKNGTLFYFFSGIAKINNKDYFVYCDKYDSLTCVSIGDSSSIRKINIHQIKTTAGPFYSSTIINNQLLLLGYENNKLWIYNINEDWTISLFRDYDFSQKISNNSIFFTINPSSTNLYYDKPFLFINYGKKNPKNKFAENAIIIFNLEDTVLKPQFVLEYPPEYRHQRIRDAELLFKATKDSLLYYSYLFSDEVGKINYKNKTSYKTFINHSCNFTVFNESQDKNLGYIAKFSLTSETNAKLLIDSSENIIIIKRVKKERSADPSVYECHVFDKNLNYKYFFKFPHSIYPRYVFEYKKGFLAFNSSLNKAYYYEIN